MALFALRASAIAIALSAAAPIVNAQSFGIAAGPTVEHGSATGGLAQLSYFTPTAFSHVGLRFDGMYMAQPGGVREGTTQAGEHSSFQASPTHTYGVVGAVSYRMGRGAVRPYALIGTGFYSRNAYTAGFTLGAKPVLERMCTCVDLRSSPRHACTCSAGRQTSRGRQRTRTAWSR